MSNSSRQMHRLHSMQPGQLERCCHPSPPATRRRWWTVDAGSPEPGGLPSPLMERTLSILLEVLKLRVAYAWKSVQLAVVMLWNAAARTGVCCCWFQKGLLWVAYLTWQQQPQ